MNSQVARRSMNDQLQSTPEAEVITSPVKSFREFYSASRLVHDQYCKCKYMEKDPSGLRLFVRDLLPTTVTFVSLFQEHIIGTATWVHNGKGGLPATNLFGQEIKQLIYSRRTVVEGTKFACIASRFGIHHEPNRPSYVAEQLLRWLFDWSCIYRIHDWIIVVNPKHRLFYEQELGFECIGRQKVCSHVNGNPGVLLRLDMKALLLGKKQMFPTARRIFAPSVQRLYNKNRVYRLGEEEVCFLLLEKPDLLTEGQEGEIEALEQEYPNVLKIVRKTLHAPFQINRASRISLAPVFSRLLKLTPDEPISLTITPHAIQLRTLLAKIVAVLSFYAKRRGVQFRCGVEDDVPDSLIADPLLLGKAVESAAESAIQSAAISGRVTLRVSLGACRGSEVNLHFSVSSALHEFPQRCKTHIEMLGGKISLAQESTNTTKLHFIIPSVVFESNISSVLVHANLPREKLRNGVLYGDNVLYQMRVLVVEDHITSQKVLLRYFEKRGAIVEIAANGKQALQALHHQMFDLILMDCQMPVMDGFETAKLIRKLTHPLKSKIPIIALTAFVMDGDRERCLSAGMNEYLTKPVSCNELLEKMIAVLQSGDQLLPSYQAQL